MKKIALILFLFVQVFPAFSQKVESQPFVFQVQNLIETLDYLGTPLMPQDKTAIRQLIENQGEPEAI